MDVEMIEGIVYVSQNEYEALDQQRLMYRDISDNFKAAIELYKAILLKLDPSGGLVPNFSIIDGKARQSVLSQIYLERWIEAHAVASAGLENKLMERNDDGQ